MIIVHTVVVLRRMLFWQQNGLPTHFKSSGEKCLWIATSKGGKYNIKNKDK